ncbi:MAG: DUF1902 domain-containing protein [candidate division SR1 bacterium CG_4_9_14_3_um_filter_40_9]|nr:MAG: DUF1902 domain-containing protein [candidate division SR1 bacterium CG_4_9_14_3_um_filter_40_9]
MKTLIDLKIEKHEEAGETYFVATSDDVQGLVAEGSTLEETIEIAYDLAKDLLHEQRKNKATLQVVPQRFSYSLMVEA